MVQFRNMVITYYGLEFFRIQFGDIIIAFNPISKGSEIKSSKFGSDITIISLNDKDFNGYENSTLGDKKPFIISGPGEYEVKNIFVKGFMSESEYGGKKRINTIYNLVIEGMNISFLGPISSFSKDDPVFEETNNVDVLFLPIGGNGSLESSEAYKLSVFMEPKIIIPMHHDGKNGSLENFLKEAGTESLPALDKLTLKKKDLENKESEVVVLKNII